MSVPSHLFATYFMFHSKVKCFQYKYVIANYHAILFIYYDYSHEKHVKYQNKFDKQRVSHYRMLGNFYIDIN